VNWEGKRGQGELIELPVDVTGVVLRKAALCYSRPEVQEVVQQRKQLPSCRISAVMRLF
jgi:hypothetical protein